MPWIASDERNMTDCIDVSKLTRVKRTLNVELFYSEGGGYAKYEYKDSVPVKVTKVEAWIEMDASAQTNGAPTFVYYGRFAEEFFEAFRRAVSA